MVPVITLLILAFIQITTIPIIISPIGSGWKINSYDDSFHDTLKTGNFTEIKKLKYDSNSVNFMATLGPGAKFAFAGITFRPESFEVNIRKYDIFEIEILPGCSDLNFTVSLRVPNFSDSLNANNSHKYHQKEFTVTDKTKLIKARFSELPTPAWWYSMNNVKREDLPPTNKSHFSSLSLSNHPSQKRSEPFSINIGRIRVLRDWKRGIPPFLFSFFISIFFLVFYFLFFKKKMLIAVNPVNIVPDSQGYIVLKFIGENYKKKGLSIEIVAKECSLTSYQVRKLISEKYGCKFNEYVRKIRIEEGARLLIDSKMDIKQIAHEVGFSHATSFNRAFKLEKHNSPSQYRNKTD